MIPGLKLKRDAYRDVFRGPTGERVLRDLARFCRAGVPTFDRDPRIDAMLQGRRDVWLRIQAFLHLSDERVVELSEVDPDE